MKLTFRFKHVDRSQPLIDFAEERFGKIRKFELKPSAATVVVSSQRHMATIEVTVVGPELTLHSQATSDDFFEATDQAISKIQRQMSKRKNRVQNHKNSKKSNQGPMDDVESLMETELETEMESEYEFETDGIRKSS